MITFITTIFYSKRLAKLIDDKYDRLTSVDTKLGKILDARLRMGLRDTPLTDYLIGKRRLNSRHMNSIWRATTRFRNLLLK